MPRYGYGVRTSRPSMGVRIDRGHPLARGLKWAATLSDGMGGAGTILNDATGQGNYAVFAGGHTPRWMAAAPPDETWIQSDGSNQFTCVRPIRLGGQGFSAACRMFLTPDPVGLFPLESAAFGLYNASGSAILQLIGSFPNSQPMIFTGSTIVATAGVTPGVSMLALTWYDVLVSVDAQKNISFYLNGNLFGTRPHDAFTNAIAIVGSCLVKLCSPASMGGLMGFDRPLLWDRPLSAGEAQQLAAAPWDLFQPPATRRFYSAQGFTGIAPTATKFTVAAPTQVPAGGGTLVPIGYPSGGIQVALFPINSVCNPAVPFTVNDGGMGGTIVGGSFSLGGVPGVGGQPSPNQSALVQYTPAAGILSGTRITLTITPTGGLGSPVTVVLTAISLPLFPGVVLVESIDDTTVSLAAANASGGTGAFSYDWWASKAPAFAPGDPGSTHLGSGATLADASLPTTHDITFYRAQVRDQSNPVQIVQTAQVPAVLQTVKNLRVAVIGDSIEGTLASTSLPNPVEYYANAMTGRFGVRSVKYYNIAQNGSASAAWYSSAGPGSCYLGLVTGTGGHGTSTPFTNDPAVSGTPWGLQTVNPTDVLIMLGTNDAHAAVPAGPAGTAGTYADNIVRLCAALFADVPSIKRIVINCPSYFFPMSIGAVVFTEASLLFSMAYAAIIPSLCNGSTIFLGDQTAWLVLSQSPRALSETRGPGVTVVEPLYRDGGVHPSGAGMIFLGNAWAAAHASALNLDPVGPGTPLSGGTSLIWG